MKKAEKIANKSLKAEKNANKSLKAEKIVNKILKYELMQIPYIVNYGNRKNIYICIKECKIEVKSPKNVSEKKIEEFVEQKADWIYRSIQKQNDVIKNKTRFEDGEQIKILGEIYTLELEYTDRKRSSIFLENRRVKLQDSKEFENQSNLELRKVKLQDSKEFENQSNLELRKVKLQVNSKLKNQVNIDFKKEPENQVNIDLKKEPENQVNIALKKEIENQVNLDLKNEIKKQLEKLYINIAQDEVEAAMLEVTELVGLRPKEYKIKKLKRAWGNCSSKKVIAINMEVAKHSREFIKYVVLHEVCHLKHMNHSKQFWGLVEKHMPDYKKIKKL